MQVQKRTAAERDLEAIWRYIAHNNPAAADATLDRIEAKLAMLSEHPLVGTPRPDLRPDLRSFTIGNYTCFYLPATDGIILIRVLHGARDIATVFTPR